MPKRSDIKKVMIIGSGPIVIGQACEFDYSGTQACKALRKLGYEIVLVNSNPATIMTDPGMADITYIEPLNLATMTEIVAKERPDALLPNLGGQSGLNLSSELARAGVLEKYGVQVIGVQIDAIKRGEDRQAFKETMNRLGIKMPQSDLAYTVEEAERIADRLGYPIVIRPAYTMGGTGGGMVFNLEEDSVGVVIFGVDNPDRLIKEGDVVVIRYEGPRGGPGMPEMLSPTSALMGFGQNPATSPSSRVCGSLLFPRDCTSSPVRY